MTSMAMETVVAQLVDAGLTLRVAVCEGLAEAPSSHLTADLRALIRSSKALLIDWLTPANAADSHAQQPLKNPVDWKELAAAYNSHHFNCLTCIAAGRGSRYGQRCGTGMSLWRLNCD